ncbi:MAG: hypothetical protein JSW54_04290 [Fidelibacterota bacterium]|nr:MAG: hypothetical protein JSW54_04290 [Candidatus Neomarinimicrobiota bacterium]
MMVSRRLNFALVLALLHVCAAQLGAQHRGDNLAFQGLSHLSVGGAKAYAMGGAFTSISGDLNGVFWNPAGLAAVEGFQLAVSARSLSGLWRENQIYRPNRLFVTLPFYLEGFYTPDPANNGRLDHELAQDTNYVVEHPELGLEPFSEAAADWQKEIDDFGISSMTAVVPLKFFGSPMVMALSYHKQSGLLDYDRNDTYLNPHLGSLEYEVLPRIDGNDTVAVDWYRFSRQRSGDIQTIRGALAIGLSDRVEVGMRLGLLSGRTDDMQALNQVGYFNLYEENEFSFSYDTLDTEVSGTSTFSAIELSAGAIIRLTNFNLGFRFTLPQILSRDWDYETVISDPDQTNTTTGSGADKLKLPAAYSLGLSFVPAEAFTIAIDFEKLPYSQAIFELANEDTTHKPWVDSSVLRFGVEFKAAAFLSLLGGYQYRTQEFVPDGAAFKAQGPAASRYTMGASIRLGRLGRIDVAYDLQQLKYYDSYYSNTNYALELRNRLTVEYVIGF